MFDPCHARGCHADGTLKVASKLESLFPRPEAQHALLPAHQTPSATTINNKHNQIDYDSLKRKSITEITANTATIATANPNTSAAATALASHRIFIAKFHQILLETHSHDGVIALTSGGAGLQGLVLVSTVPDNSVATVSQHN